MQIEMSGKEDREGPWKFAIAGQPGSGKTMLSSTAPDPLFVFFQEQPRIKSVADRSIQHVKIVNDFTSGAYALDQMHGLLMHLQLGDHDFKTLVIDTGDEFFQQLKAGRTYQNGGEFNIGDWSWIADAYREVMLALIDLPMHVIVTFHVKGTGDEDPAKELMLQGAAKDEAAGWFDIVGALDTYEIVDEHGETVTKRVMLTSNSRVYPWVKDHSGALPRRWELSEHITNDIPKMLELTSADLGTASREVVTVVDAPDAPPAAVNADIPSPEELDAKKAEAHETPEQEPVVEETAAPIDTPDTPAPQPIAEKGESNLTVEPEQAVPTEGPSEPAKAAEPEQVGSQAQVESAAEPPNHIESESKPLHQIEDATDEAVATVTEILGAEEVPSGVVCEVCGEEVTDTDLQELTQIRFQKWLCRPHFKEMLTA
jgi:hypothetical protein